jgi:hypothetical protein
MPASPAGRPGQRPPRRRLRPAPARRPRWARQRDPAPARSPRDWIAITATALPGIAALGALIFAALSVTATGNQLKIAEQGQITDRYNAAITNLGSDSIEIRLGGIYALQRLMQDSPRDQPTIIAVLCAFVRDQAPSPAKPLTLRAAVSYRQPTDVQAALTVVATRDTAHDTRATVVDFDNGLLAAAQLDFGHLFRADLIGADLGFASLTSADLHGAELNAADLNGANLFRADLHSADFTYANLYRANLIGANLHGALFFHANLHRADLLNANLQGAEFLNANLQGADLASANLHRADFTDADLTHALWPTDAPVPTGWIRNTQSGRLTRAS